VTSSTATLSTFWKKRRASLPSRAKMLVKTTHACVNFFRCALGTIANAWKGASPCYAHT
jgi:hypothetical protein